MPVCSSKVALAAWDRHYNGNRTYYAPQYPCDPEPEYSVGGNRVCADYTFVNETSEASPKVSDCRRMLENLADGKGIWTTTLGRQRMIASFPTDDKHGCKFGVEAGAAHGNANYHVGAQDITDLVLESIKMYAGDERIGAKGVMTCNTNTHAKEKVTWGLY